MHFKAPHFRQSTGHKVSVGATITLFTGAFLLTSGISTKVYSQDKKKGGDAVLLMQTGPSFKTQEAKKDTTKTMEYVPAPLRPYLKTLEYYIPLPLTLKEFADLKNMTPKERENSQVESFRVPWRSVGNCTPFQQPQSRLDSLPPEDRKLVYDKWDGKDGAAVKLIVAFTVQNGLTPKDALNPAKGGYDPNSAEVDKMVKDWNAARSMDWHGDDFYERRSNPQKK